MNKFYLILVAVLLGLTGCSSEEDFLEPKKGGDKEGTTIPEVYFTVSDTARLVKTEAKAMEIAGRFLSDSDLKTRTSMDVEVSTIYQEDGNPAMYVVNYGEDEGFVIVSATKDTEPILAYSDTGSFSLDDIEGTPAGMWLNDSRIYVESSSTLPDSLKLSVAQQWERLTSTTVPASKLQTRGWRDHDEVVAVYNALEYYRSQGYEIYENPEPNVHIYSPDLNRALEALSDEKDGEGFSQREKSYLLFRTSYFCESANSEISTLWQQDAPYNDKLKDEYHSNLDLGCVPVAVAQLMKYYKNPVGGFLYDKMPDRLSDETRGTEGHEILTSFLFHIGKSLGIDYENGKSGALDSKAVSVLMSYGFPKVKIVNYDSNFMDIKYALYDGPIYLTAIRIKDGKKSGHSWVGDGYVGNHYNHEYLIISYNGNYMDVIPTACFDNIYRETSGNFQQFLHMNWGWSESFNGYYSANYWTINNTSEGTVSYDYDRKAIIGFK